MLSILTQVLASIGLLVQQTHSQPVSAFCRVNDLASVCILDNESLLTASTDGILLIWDIKSGKLRKRIKTSLALTSPSVMDDGKTLVSVANSSAVAVVDLTEKSKPRLIGPKTRVRNVVVSPSAKHIAMCCADGTVRIYDFAGGNEITALNPTILNGAKPAVASFSRDSASIAAAYSGLSSDVANNVFVWDLKSLKRTHEYHAAGGVNVCALCFSPAQADLLAVPGSAGSSVALWRLNSDRPPVTQAKLPYFASSLKYSPDGKQLACASFDGHLAVFRGDNLIGQRHFPFPIYEIAFSPDSKLIAIRSYNSEKKAGEIILWDAANGRYFGNE